MIEGRVDTSSFASKVTALTVQDEDGSSSGAPVDSTGAFKLTLPSGHVYKLSVELQQGNALLLFPKSDRVDDAFALDSDGAEVQLGTIRALNAESISLGSSPTSCPDGVIEDGGVPCSVTTDTVNCTQGYASTPASCDDVEVVLGYGTMTSLIGAAPTGAIFAVPAIEPPCNIVGCDLPAPANPRQGTVAD